MSDPTNPESPEKEVWIGCRATENCPGRKAVIVFAIRFDPLGIGGTKIAEGSGKGIRYRCTTCGHTFYIKQ